MNPQNQQVIDFCLQAIKQKLNELKISYRDLSRILNVSEVSVKRLMNSTNIKMDKLLTLCDITGIHLADLMAKAIQTPAKHYVFNQMQDHAFTLYPELLQFFTELSVERKQVADIKEEYELNESSIHIYLRALEKLKLISVSTNNKVSILVEAPFGFDADSRFLKSNLVSCLEETCHRILNVSQDNDFFLLKPLTLSDNLYVQLLEDLSATVDKYAQLSETTSPYTHANEYVLALAAHESTLKKDTLIINKKELNIDI